MRDSSPEMRFAWSVLVAVSLVASMVVDVAARTDVRRKVPDVVGKSIQEATTILRGEGFKIAIESFLTDDSTKWGVLSKQRPEGDKMSREKTVTVFVGKPGGRLRDLIGKTPDEARAAVEASGLRFGQQESMELPSKELLRRMGLREDAAIGKVVKQDPAPGWIPKSRTVSVWIATARQVGPVPDLIGLTLEEVNRQLAASGFRPRIMGSTPTETYDKKAKKRKKNEHLKGRVAKQVPGGGREHELSKPVKIWFGE